MPRKPYFRNFDGWWYAQINQGGKRKQHKLVKGKDKEQDAYRAFCRLMADETGELPDQTAQTVATVCDFFLDRSQRDCKASTYELYKSFLQSFCDRYGRIHVSQLKHFHITKWLDAHPTWKACRRHAALAAKRAFRWCFLQGLIGKDPLATFKPEPGNSRSRVLSAGERKLILASIKDQPFRDFVFAMQETGCRPGEASAVTAADVNLDLGVWVLAKHKTAKKTGRPRVIYLTAPMIELCRRLVERFPAGPLFRGPRGQKPFNKNSIRCRFRRLREKLPQLKGVVAYTFRATFATNALENGVGVAQVAELLGHTSTEMLMKHYSMLSQRVQHLREMAQKATAT